MKHYSTESNKRILGLAGAVMAIATLSIFMQFAMLYGIGKANLSQVFILASTVLMQMAGLVIMIYVNAKNQLKIVSDLAYIDELTGLINRRKFNEVLSEQLMTCRATNKKLGVLILDLDRFKSINDSHGHDAGDKIICQFGELIKKVAGNNAITCRMSGDEFAVMVTDVTSDADILLICNAVLKEMKKPFIYESKKICAGASIGGAIVDGYEDEGLTALRMADYALLQAKENGRNQFMFFSEKMAISIKRRQNIEAGLKKAISNKNVTLKYQPFVLQEEGSISGVEALIRWEDPIEGEIFPSEFIPIAQEMGFIDELGEFILERACSEIKSLKDIRLAVNISEAQFTNDGFISQVRRVLKKTNFEAQRLEFELSQNLLVSNSLKIKSTLKALRDLGVRITLDDFGTSYASMFFLRDFKLDRIKLDRNFVDNMKHEKDGIDIVENMIALGTSFSDRLTVEGVETVEQFKRLQETQANDLQGFLFSKPLSLSELIDSQMIQDFDSALIKEEASKSYDEPIKLMAS